MTGFHHSEETKRKLSEINKGKSSPMKGKHHSEESKLKISITRKGKPLSEEHRKKLSEAGKGRYYSEETRQKMSENNKGKNLGKHHTEETRKKMSNSKKNKPLSGKALEHVLEINARKKGKSLSEEQKQKMSESMKGRPSWNKGKKSSEETRKKISEHHRHYQTEEARKKTSIGNRGKKRSEEIRREMSERLKGNKLSLGHKHTPESIEKMSIAVKQRYIDHPESKKNLIINGKKEENIKRLRSGKKTSKSQLKLFEIIKKLYPAYHVEPEWKVETKEGIRHIDVAIPELKTGFEFDGKYWHKNTKEKDLHRHQLIEAEGWKLTHYSDEKEFC